MSFTMTYQAIEILEKFFVVEEDDIIMKLGGGVASAPAAGKVEATVDEDGDFHI